MRTLLRTLLKELPAEVIAFNNTTFQIQYSPSHTDNVRGSYTIYFTYCMSLISLSACQNLITENKLQQMAYLKYFILVL